VYDQSVGAGFKAAPTNHFTQQFKDGSLNLITAITKNFSCIFVFFVVNNLMHESHESYNRVIVYVPKFTTNL
ncbi:MAG: hypothetical protein WC966_11725, partial [Bradymonadales bacterium]